MGKVLRPTLDHRGVRGRLELLQTIGKLEEERSSAESCHVGAQAEVLTGPEAEVAVRVAGDIEVEGILEHRVVAIGRGVEQDQVLALAQGLAVELHVLEHGAPHVVHGRGPADHLFDRLLGEIRVLAEQVELVGVLQERGHAAGDRVARGVVAGGEDDQVVAEGLDRTHRLAVGHLRGGEQGREVVARMRASVLDDPVEEREELRAERLDRLLAVLPFALQVGIVGGEELLRQLQHLLLLVLVDAENGGEDAQRVSLGDRLDEVALAFLAELVDLLARAPGHDLVEVVNVAGREEAARHLAEVPMLGRIHLDDGAHIPERPLLECAPRQLLPVEDHGTAPIAEDLGLARNVHDVGVTRDRVEGLVGLGLAVVDRRVRAQPAPGAVGLAGDAVVAGDDQVVGIDLECHLGSCLGGRARPRSPRRTRAASTRRYSAPGWRPPSSQSTRYRRGLSQTMCWAASGLTASKVFCAALYAPG